MDVEYFPFDEQTCVMKFGSWTYDGFQVNSLLIIDLRIISSRFRLISATRTQIFAVKSMKSLATKVRGITSTPSSCTSASWLSCCSGRRVPLSVEVAVFCMFLDPGPDSRNLCQGSLEVRR